MRKYNGISADSESEIIVSSGSTGAFYCACLALINPGDEVILFEPYYGYHVNTILAAEAVPVYVSMNPPDWSFSPEDLERVVAPQKVITLDLFTGNDQLKTNTVLQMRDAGIDFKTI